MTDLKVQAFNLKDEGRIYLDHNASTPLASELLPYIQNHLKSWGNPSSIHQHGRGPKALLRSARTSIAEMIGCSSLEIIFTSGGSESNNQVIKTLMLDRFPTETLLANPRQQLIISAVEHPSVMKTADYLSQRHNIEVIKVPVSRNGVFDIDFYKKNLSEKTALVSVMAANNETGHIFPIQEIAALAHEKGALVHTDAVQTLGKIPINVREWGVDYASFSGHKFYSLKGCGLIYQKKGRELPSMIHGGAQERRRRAGTENTLAIACLGQIATHKDQVILQAQRLEKLKSQMENSIASKITGVQINGVENPRLPGSSSMLIEGIDGETLLMNLDIEGYSISTGAACSSGSPEPSPVLIAMGLSRAEAQSSLRIGLGWGTTEAEVNQFVQALIKIVARIRGFKNAEVQNG